MSGLLAGGVGAAVAYSRHAEPLELAGYDLLQAQSRRYQPARGAEPVVTVAIDDASIDDVRRKRSLGWPWPRALVGRGVEELSALGAKVIVLDRLYEDPSPHGTADEVAFAKSLSAAGNVVVAARTAELGYPLVPLEGRWAVRVREAATLAEVLPDAAALLAWQHRVFAVPDAQGVGLWVGGFTSKHATEQGLAGLGAQGEHPLPRAPEIRELTPQELDHPVDAETWVAARDALTAPGLSSLGVTRSDDWLLPRPEIAAAALRVGFDGPASVIANALDPLDDDGADPTASLARSAPLFIRRGDALYPTLPLAALLAFHRDDPGYALSVGGGRLHLGASSVPVTSRGFVYVDAPSDAQRAGVRAVGFSRILHSAATRAAHLPIDAKLADAFRGRVVVVTRASGRASGPETGRPRRAERVTAALQTLMRGDAVARVPPVRDARWAFGLGLLGALYSLIVFRYARSSAFIAVGLLGVLAGAALYAGYALLLFVDQRVWLALVVPALAFAAAALTTGWINHGETSADRARIGEALGRFAPPSVVEAVLRRPILIAPKRQEVTVLFCDMVGFTALSESMPAPRLAELMETFFTEITGLVTQTQGHVDKLVGDAVMAFWNAPIPQSKHAQQACKAALAMREKLEKLRAGLLKEYGVDVKARIGLCTGEAAVGELGARSRAGQRVSIYTCLGDTVRLASRLERANRAYATTILCDARTAELCGGMTFREIDTLRVPGRREALAVFELVAARGDAVAPARAQVLERYAQGLAAYRSRDFAGAKSHFDAALAAVPGDGPSAIFRERARRLEREPPPEDWVGEHAVAEG